MPTSWRGMLSTVTYGATPLDFYGTVVQEDDATIQSIVHKIARTHPDCTDDELGRLWGREFASLLLTSRGDLFRATASREWSSMSGKITHL